MVREGRGLVLQKNEVVKIAARAVAGIRVLTIKWLSPLVFSL